MKESNSNKREYLIRLLAIVMIFVCLLIPVSYMQKNLCIPLTQDYVRFDLFQKEPDNSLDVIMLGSSATYTGFSSVHAYDRFGFTSYPFTWGGASCNMWKPAVEFALRSQKPKLIAVDVFGGGYDAETVLNRKAVLYVITNSMPLSMQKIKMACEMNENIDTKDTMGLIFPFIRYHSNIPSNMKDREERKKLENYGPSLFKGVETETRARDLPQMTKERQTDEAEPLDGKTEGMIRDFVEYCNDQDLEVLFIKYPCIMTMEKQYDANRRQNSVMNLARELGCETLDLQKRFHEIGLDVKKDFYDEGHTNTRGQKKLTEFVGRYIQDEMGIEPSHLDEDRKAEWDRSVEYYNILCEISEDMLSRGEIKVISDSPELVDKVEEAMKN